MAALKKVAMQRHTRAQTILKQETPTSQFDNWFLNGVKKVRFLFTANSIVR